MDCCAICKWTFSAEQQPLHWLQVKVNAMEFLKTGIWAKQALWHHNRARIHQESLQFPLVMTLLSNISILSYTHSDNQGGFPPTPRRNTTISILLIFSHLPHVSSEIISHSQHGKHFNPSLAIMSLREKKSAPIPPVTENTSMTHYSTMGAATVKREFLPFSPPPQHPCYSGM